MLSLPRLVLTAGEPAGIGTEIIVKALQQAWPVDIMVVGDPQLLAACAEHLQLPLRVECIDENSSRQWHQPGTVRVRAVEVRAPVTLGELNPKNAEYVLETLMVANQIVMHHPSTAMVTAPVHKGILSRPEQPFHGHTEFLRDQCGVVKTIMLFVTSHFKAALFTTHLPLKNVSEHVQAPALKQTLALLHDEMRVRFAVLAPRIGVCGLNPHAGEGGLLGDEELTTMQPVITELQQAGYDISGPYSADTIFTPERVAQFDVILGMYHDQVLPLVKYLGFGSSVNVTLGLPYIRTSVDHGTALDIAPFSTADESSLCQAMQCALQLLAVEDSQR